MDPTTTTTTASFTADDTSPFKRQHDHNFLLDDDIQKRLLLATDDDDCDDNYTDPQPTTSVMGHLLDNDPHPWHSGWVHRTEQATDSTTSVHHRARGPRINYVTRYSTGNRSKEIPFSFHHYADPARYMEQYRRDYTYANLDPVKVVEDQFPWADHRLRQTTQCQTGRTEMYSKRHSAPSIDFQDQRLDWNHHRTMRDSTSVDGLSRALRRNLEVFENSETSGLSSTNKFWTFDTSHVLPVLYNNNSNNNNTVGTERTRCLGGSAMELGGGLAVFSGKEAKHFPGNGFAMDDQSVKRLSYSRVSNLQLPIAGLRAVDILTHNSHARARLTQQHRSLDVSTTLPVIR